MRRNLLLGLFLPFTLVLGTAGAGFAVWYFGENENKKENDNKVTVEKYVGEDFGTLTLEYGEEDDENHLEHDESIDHVNPFLYITQTDISFASPIKVTFQFKENPNIDYSTFTYSFHYEIALSETFYSYFRMVYPLINNTDERKTEDYLVHPTLNKKMQNITYAELKDQNGFKNALLPVAFTYRSGAIPTSKVAFEAMWSALDSGMKTTPLVKFSYYLTVTSVNS